MSAAVLVHEITKQFGKPVLPALNRRTRFSSSGTGHLVKSSQPPRAVVAVDHVSFAVQEGEIFGLLGPAGSAKTTLIHLLGTLLLPDSGDIRIFGYDVARHALQAQRMINRVSVQASFFKQRSPLQNLLDGAHLFGLSGAQARLQVIEMLLRLGLEENEIYLPMEAMSRSQQQMVVIARALLSRPRLLLLDEPTLGLDAFSRRNIHQALREARDLRNMTILVATTDPLEANCLCDRIAVMEAGKLLALDTPYSLAEQPAFGGYGLTLEKSGPVWFNSVMSAKE